MELIWNSFLTIHVFAGVLSLLVFLIPVFSIKGSSTHRKLGKLYVKCMIVVVFTALILSLIRLTQGKYPVGIFLGYLSLLTAQPLWYGIEVLKHPNTPSDKVLFIKKVSQGLLVILGLAVGVYGIVLGISGIGLLLIIFGFLGASSAPKIFVSKATVIENHHRVSEHMEEMISTGIAAYTAFLAFGGRAILSDILIGYWQFVPWILPSILGFVYIRFKKKKLLNKKTIITPFDASGGDA